MSKSSSTATQIPKKLAVIYNPVKISRDKLESHLTKVLKPHGKAEVIWYETTESDAGQGFAEAALKAKAEVVLVAGGDGTVRAVSEVLRNSKVPMALVPSGTGNILARNLKIPLHNLDQALEIALTGISTPVDLGIINIQQVADDLATLKTTPITTRLETVFLVLAGVGIDAELIAQTDPNLKKRVGWLAYVAGGLRALFSSKRIKIKYQLDNNEAKQIRAHSMLIGNCGELPASIQLIPEAKFDDGILDVIALRPSGVMGWVEIWLKIVWENGILRRSNVGKKLISNQKPIRTLRYFQTQTIKLQLSSPAPLQLDGDLFGHTLGFETLVDSKSLLVKTKT